MAAKKPSRKTRRSRATANPDAIALLKADHKNVDEMFKSFDNLKDLGSRMLQRKTELQQGGDPTLAL